MQTERTRTNQSLFYTASELSTLAKRKWANGLHEKSRAIYEQFTKVIRPARRIVACSDAPNHLKQRVWHIGASDYSTSGAYRTTNKTTM